MRGSVAVLCVAWMALFVVCISLLGHVARIVVEQSTLQSAADSVALALASNGRQAAAGVAEAHGVVITNADGGSGIHHVVVCHGLVCASATAVP